jgi:hypothetical protein
VDELGTALERLLERLDQPRRVSPVEAPRVLTNAYARSMIAFGFARIGNVERARDLLAGAFTDLDRNDAVHGCLVEVFTARVEMAIAGRARDAPLPESTLDRLAQLDRISAYKVSRLWAASWILQPGFKRVEPTMMNAPRRTQWSGSEVFSLDAPPDVRAMRIAAHLESSTGLERSGRFARIAECLEGLIDLPESAAMSILTRAVHVIDAAPNPPIELRVSVLQRIAQFGWGELVPVMFEPFAAQLVALPPDRLGTPLLAALQALRRLDLREELGRVAAAFEPALTTLPNHAMGDDWGAPGALYALAGVLDLLGDPRGDAIVEPALEHLEDGKLTITQVLQTIRVMAAGYAFTSIPRAVEGVEKLCSSWSSITDSFGTNTHFCLAILDTVDALVVGISEARLGRGAP